MPTVSVDVDVDLNDIDTDDLVDELESRLRKFSRKEKEDLKEFLQPLSDILFDNPFEDIEIKTLEDQMKIEHLIKVFYKYTSSQMETLLP